MEAPTLFKISTGILGTVFLYYGMDVRRKEGACDFVAPVWQMFMKLCAISLIVGFAWLVLSMREANAIDWLGLAFIASGTAFVTAAKRTLGKMHTFTGQYLNKPHLVTHGVYSITKNPLYFGVFQCHLGALLCAVYHVPALLPQSYPYWLGGFGAALVYAVSFNWAMAVREESQLERRFPDTYRCYRSTVPFLVPFLRSRPEVQ